MAKRSGSFHMVKRRGHLERFDERKLYASVFAACLSAQIPERDSEKISDSVCREVVRRISKKEEVSAHQIYKEAVESLRKKDKNAAFMYDSHMDIS